MATLLGRVWRKFVRVSQRVRGVRENTGYYWNNDITEETLEADVKHAVAMADSYCKYIEKMGQDWPGRNVLELGPGKNLGSLLVLAGLGANIWAADRFLVRWSPEYHPAFYRRLRDWLSINRPQVSVQPIERVLAAKQHEAACQFLYLPCENLNAIETGSMDIILSNAVLEHLSDPLQSFKELARITKMGGVGAHQVDFRFHNFFDRPLEQLLYSPAEFQKIWDGCKGGCGCQWRREEYQAWLGEVGFEILEYFATCFATDEYLDEFEPRLCAAQGSKYKNWPREKLRETGGNFLMRKR